MFHIADGLYIYMLTQLGGQHVIIPRFEPEACAKALEKYHINVTILVPTMIQMLLDYPGLTDCDLSEFATLYYGASPMPEATLVRNSAANRSDSTLWPNGIGAAAYLYVE